MLSRILSVFSPKQVLHLRAPIITHSTLLFTVPVLIPMITSCTYRQAYIGQKYPFFVSRRAQQDLTEANTVTWAFLSPFLLQIPKTLVTSSPPDELMPFKWQSDERGVFPLTGQGRQPAPFTRPDENAERPRARPGHTAIIWQGTLAPCHLVDVLPVTPGGNGRSAQQSTTSPFPSLSSTLWIVRARSWLQAREFWKAGQHISEGSCKLGTFVHRHFSKVTNIKQAATYLSALRRVALESN